MPSEARHSKRILPGEHSVPWRANKCERKKQTKHKKERRCVHNSFKVVTFLGLYNHNYVNSSKTVPHRPSRREEASLLFSGISL